MSKPGMVTLPAHWEISSGTESGFKAFGNTKACGKQGFLRTHFFPITFIRRTFASLALRVKNFQKNLNKENHQVYIATLAPLSSLLQKASAALLGHVRVSTHRHSAIPLDR